MEITLVILKPSAVQRRLSGDIITRFEKKGLQIVAMKMLFLSDAILAEHYSHLKDKPFFSRIKESMQMSPVILLALKGVDAVRVVRNMTGLTNGREAQPGTIRGDLSMSVQENLVHASDSLENAQIELNRFFSKDEFFTYPQLMLPTIYANDEY